MSLECVVWALRVTDELVGDSALRTLAVLADYANDQQVAFPSVKRLEADRGASRATIYRHLKALREAGYIVPGDDGWVAHIEGGKRPQVWFVNAWMRGLNSETPQDLWGLTPQGSGVSSGATAKEEPRTSVETKTQPSPTRTRVSERSTALASHPGRDCIHGEEALTYVNPKTGRVQPRCPFCRKHGFIRLAALETADA